MIPGWGRSLGEGHGNPIQYSCLENPHEQRSLVGYNPWGQKESDAIESLSTYLEHVNFSGSFRLEFYRVNSICLKEPLWLLWCQFLRTVFNRVLIPGSGRSPGEGNIYPLKYSCLENSMDRGALWGTVCGVTVRDNWATNAFTFFFSYFKNCAKQCITLWSSMLLKGEWLRFSYNPKIQKDIKGYI